LASHKCVATPGLRNTALNNTGLKTLSLRNLFPIENSKTLYLNEYLTGALNESLTI
jgi:hypothetical protein